MKAAQIVLIEDNPADVFLVELALKESGVTYEMTRFKSGGDTSKCRASPVTRRNGATAASAMGTTAKAGAD